MDVGSAENAGSNFQPTYTDGGSADIASLHGCNLLGQCICPWWENAGSNFLPYYRQSWIQGILFMCFSNMKAEFRWLWWMQWFWQRNIAATVRIITEHRKVQLLTRQMIRIALVQDRQPQGCGCRAYMARIVPTILLHFLHPWRSDVFTACPE